MTLDDFLANYPAFSNGTLSLNGVEKASTKKNGNTINSNYNFDDFEKLAWDYAQENIAKNLPSVNVFTPDVLKSLDAQVNAFKDNAIKEINSVYEPMLNALKNDIASRFGSFTNSVFMNNLNNIENKRADAIAALANDVVAKQNELKDEELNRRYNYLNFLNNYQNSVYDNILNMVKTTQTNSQMGNAYNNNAYQNAYSNYLYNQKLKSDASDFASQALLTALMKTLG